MSAIDKNVDLQNQIAELEKRVAECEREFSTLTKITQTLISTIELEPLLAVILDQLKTLIDYDAAGIVLVENDLARFAEYRGPVPRDVIMSWRFPQGIAGFQHVARNSGALVVGDIKADGEFSRIYRASLGDLIHYFNDVRSWLAVPLVARGNIIGFLRMSRTTPNFFTPQHARFAEAVAGPAAIAIENARLLKVERARVEEVERRRVVAESLRGILAALNSNAPSDQILDYILEQGCRVLGTDTAVIYRLNNESNILLPRAARNIPSDILQKMNIAVGTGVVGQAVEQHRPVVVTDFDNVPMPPLTTRDDRDFLVRWAKENFVSMLGIPLLIKDQVYGGISLFFRELCCPLTPDDIALAKSFADQAALAIENARLYSQASDIASLEERQRLARELHDSVSQALYGIQLGSQTARELLNSDLPPNELCTALVEPLDYVQSLAEAGLAEMRALIFELRPESLKTEGLVGALTKQANALRVRHHLQVDIELGEEPDLSFEAKEALYRIAQEALHNMVKHARATRVAVRLKNTDGSVELDVEDDGRGFDPAGTFPGHLGLRSMRERIEHLDGILEIASAPGRGTKISARIFWGNYHGA